MTVADAGVAITWKSPTVSVSVAVLSATTASGSFAVTLAVIFNVALLTGLTPSGMKTAVISMATVGPTGSEPKLHWTGGPTVHVPCCGVAAETVPDNEKVIFILTPVAAEAPELSIVR